MDGFRADSDAVLKPWRGHGCPAAIVGDIDKRTDLLSPVSGNASADGEDPQSLLTRDNSTVFVEIKEWVERLYAAELPDWPGEWTSDWEYGTQGGEAGCYYSIIRKPDIWRVVIWCGS